MTSPAALQALLNGDTDNYFAAMTPGGIEAQEAQGQKTFVNSSTLPKDINDRNITRKTLEDMGIVFGNDADDLFVNVTLPAGWKKVATDHSMWSELKDEKDRKRAMIFYKAAFYDRSAHMNLSSRFSLNAYHRNDQDQLETVVMDGDAIIFSAGSRASDYSDESYRIGDEQSKVANTWLNEHYPDWKNPLAYWD